MQNNIKGFHGNIEQSTIDNTLFRKVLYTAKNLQLVLRMQLYMRQKKLQTMMSMMSLMEKRQSNYSFN
jgi:hypothetical protein